MLPEGAQLAAEGSRFPAWSLGLAVTFAHADERSEANDPAVGTSAPARRNMSQLVTMICSPALNTATSPYLFVGQSARGSANSVPRSDKYG